MQGLDGQVNFTHEETLRISKHENNKIKVLFEDKSNTMLLDGPKKFSH